MEVNPENMLRYGHTPPSPPLAYDHRIKSLFFRMIVDPSRFMKKGILRQNFCVLAGIIISIRTSLGLMRGSKQEMENDISALNYQNLFKLGKKGLSLGDLEIIENKNSPIPDKLKNRFINLQYFQGFSINLFQIRQSEDIFKVLPIALSKNNRNSNFFQVDLLKLTNDLLEPNSTNTASSTPGHVLVIRNLARLLTKFTHSSNWRRYSEVCRSCMRTFVTTKLRKEHQLMCPDHARRGQIIKKKCLNSFIHLPTIINKFNGKTQVNGLYWKRKDAFKCLRPLSVIYADLESFSGGIDVRNISAFDKTPRSAEKIQLSMSYSYCFAQLYQNIKVPRNLRFPRIKFCSHTGDNTEKDLYIDFLLSLRNDLVRHSQWIENVLTKDRGVPSPNTWSAEMIRYFKSCNSCQFCGRIFGTRLWSAASKSFYHVQKNFDHNHYQTPFGFPAIYTSIRAILCR